MGQFHAVESEDEDDDDVVMLRTSLSEFRALSYGLSGLDSLANRMRNDFLAALELSKKGAGDADAPSPQ